MDKSFSKKVKFLCFSYIDQLHGWTVTKFLKKYKKSVDIFWQAWYYNWAADEQQQNKKNKKNKLKKLLTNRFLSCKIEKHVWRDIEAVITRRSWKPFVRKGAWVRIPPSPVKAEQFVLLFCLLKIPKGFPDK